MSDAQREGLLSRLFGSHDGQEDAAAWANIPTTEPDHDDAEAQQAAIVDEPAETVDTEAADAPEANRENDDRGPQSGGDRDLDRLVERIYELSDGTEPRPPAIRPANEFGVREGSEPAADGEWYPVEPATFRAAHLSESEVEALLLKCLVARGAMTGRNLADQVKLPFQLVDGLLRELKTQQLVVYRGAAAMNDYEYQLTDLGIERGRRLIYHCTYFGSAPVSLADYIASVEAQSLVGQHPTEEDLHRAFSDLLLNKQMLERLGPAINSGRGLFLYGAPGNGKTSIAERVTGAFGEAIWIPRALGIDGEIIRIFDPTNHEELPIAENRGLIDDRRIDKRWVRIRRPTLVVGGELTMDSLEVTTTTSGISEAPVQLKSNCGTLVIDDFGRQRMTTDELLNRWIVPLEKRYDFLNLPNGKKFQVPFDQLVIFSTNLQPKDLVDDAFLRRIPYKIDVVDPTTEEFIDLFKLMCPKLGFEYDQEVIDYLIRTHYEETGRPMRCCHPRDLLMQVRNYCLYRKLPITLTPEYFDFAVDNYFAVM